VVDISIMWSDSTKSNFSKTSTS